MGNALHVTDDSFEQEVLKSELPVLIDFWAIWCGPCMAIGPTIEELATEYEGRFKVCKVDVDANQQIGMNYGIRSIPTLLIFKEGKLVDTIVGAVPKQTIVKKMDAVL